MCRRIFFDTMVPVRKIYSRCVRHRNCVRHSPNFAYALVEILHTSLRPRFPRSQSPHFCRWLLCGNGSSIWRSPVTIHSALPLYPLGGGNGAFGAPLNRSIGSELSAHSAAAAGGCLPSRSRGRRGRGGSAHFCEQALWRLSAPICCDGRMPEPLSTAETNQN